MLNFLFYVFVTILFIFATEVKANQQVVTIQIQQQIATLQAKLLADKGNRKLQQKIVNLSLKHAQQLYLQRNFLQAKQVLIAVFPLAKKVPDHQITKQIYQLSQRIDTIILKDTSLQQEHIRTVEAVRNLLYQAESDYNLGKFDEAYNKYLKILVVDPYNIAALQGKIKVASQKKSFYNEGRKATRQQLLNQVSAEWSTDANNSIKSDNLTLSNATDSNANVQDDSILTILQQLRVSSFVIENATLERALRKLSLQLNQYLSTQLPDNQQKINFVINYGNLLPAEKQKIQQAVYSLSIGKISALQCLDIFCKATKTKYFIDIYSITITPLQVEDTSFVTRSIALPGGFYQELKSLQASANANNFNDTDNTVISQGIKPLLKEILNINFPQGSTVIFNPAKNILFVKHNRETINKIYTLVDQIKNQKQSLIKVEVIMINVNAITLNELGFNWMFGDKNVGNSLILTGGTEATTDAFNQTFRSLTSGLRNSSTALERNTIDNLISANNGSVNPFASLNVNRDNIMFALLLQGLSRKTSSDNLLKPSIILKSGQSAEIRSTREVIFPEQYDAPQLPSTINFGGSSSNSTAGNSLSFVPITPATPSSFVKRDIGTVLRVSATSYPEKGRIQLTLNMEQTSFQGFVNYGSTVSALALNTSGDVERQNVMSNNILQPIIGKINLQTDIEINNGSFFAIGGVMAASPQSFHDKVPILGDLPIIGRLFQSKGQQTNNNHIILFVKATTIDPAGRTVTHN